jgi:hypothetical protein
MALLALIAFLLAGAVTALLLDEDVNAWWLLPVAIQARLSTSAITAAGTTSRGGRDSRKHSATSPMAHG